MNYLLLRAFGQFQAISGRSFYFRGGSILRTFPTSSRWKDGAHPRWNDNPDSEEMQFGLLDLFGRYGGWNRETRADEQGQAFDMGSKTGFWCGEELGHRLSLEHLYYHRTLFHKK
jgi:hypothetical protein